MVAVAVDTAVSEGCPQAAKPKVMRMKIVIKPVILVMVCPSDLVQPQNYTRKIIDIC
jgi:hypothetical protein